MGKKFKNKDLAARLGVSGTLVSLVLNNKADQQGIRKDTQEKVLMLARQMGYYDSLQEKNKTSPVEEKPGVLGMIVPSISDPFVIQITPFLQKAFSSIGVGFSIVTKDPDDQRYDRLVGAFKKFYSGLILLGDAADEATIRALRTTDYPFVLLERPSKTLRLNTVSTDTVAGAQLVVNHLDKLGYKNVIIIADHRSSRSDTTAIQDIIATLGQKSGINKPVVIELNKRLSGDDIDSEQFEMYLRPPYRADVMVIMNANLVYPIMTLLRKKKLRVPQDIAVIGYDNVPLSSIISPTLTTINQPVLTMCLQGTNMLQNMITGNEDSRRRIMLEPSIIIRESAPQET